MKKRLLPLVAAVSVPALATAGEVELAGYGGYALPFYSQTFPYDPGPIDIPIPGVTVEQGGEFTLDASGGPAFSGGFTFYASDSFGLEVRLDSADVSLGTTANTYSVHVELPPPHDPVRTDLRLTAGEAALGPLRPWSFNVKLRSGGESVRLTTSGGISRLGGVGLSIDQTVALGVVAVNLETSALEIATLRLRGVAAEDLTSSWGGNLGLGIQIGVGERGAVILEGRGFYFPKRTFEWERETDESLSPVQELLLERVLARLDPIELKPWWVQATIGVAIRF
jgi:hypothetical protein